MIGLMSEITDGTTIYIFIHRRSKCDKVPRLKAQARLEPTFSNCKSDALTARLTCQNLLLNLSWSDFGGSYVGKKVIWDRPWWFYLRRPTTSSFSCFKTVKIFVTKLD